MTKEGGQGMKVIEKTRWKGDKAVGFDVCAGNMERGMNELKKV